MTAAAANSHTPYTATNTGPTHPFQGHISSRPINIVPFSSPFECALRDHEKETAGWHWPNTCSAPTRSRRATRDLRRISHGPLFLETKHLGALCEFWRNDSRIMKISSVPSRLCLGFHHQLERPWRAYWSGVFGLGRRRWVFRVGVPNACSVAVSTCEGYIFWLCHPALCMCLSSVPVRVFPDVRVY